MAPPLNKAAGTRQATAICLSRQLRVGTTNGQSLCAGPESPAGQFRPFLPGCSQARPNGQKRVTRPTARRTTPKPISVISPRANKNALLLGRTGSQREPLVAVPCLAVRGLSRTCCDWAAKGLPPVETKLRLAEHPPGNRDDERQGEPEHPLQQPDRSFEPQHGGVQIRPGSSDGGVQIRPGGSDGGFDPSWWPSDPPWWQRRRRSDPSWWPSDPPSSQADRRVRRRSRPPSPRPGRRERRRSSGGGHSARCRLRSLSCNRCYSGSRPEQTIVRCGMRRISRRACGRIPKRLKVCRRSRPRRPPPAP